MFSASPEASAQPLRPKVSAGASAGASLDRFWTKVDGRMTQVFLAMMVGTYVLQFIVALSFGAAAHNALFTIDRGVLLRPWTIFTSIFAHSLASLNHLLINSLVLYFFGSAVERLIGTKRFALLFITAGAVAGLAQITLFEGAALGASGAIQGIMGTLVILAPRLTVLVFFVIPAPLWLLTIAFVLFDVLGAFNPDSGVAHIAHLAGLAAGLAYGYRLKQQGIRVNVAPPPQRRYF